MSSELYKRFEGNMRRVESLISIYESLRESDFSFDKETKVADILRAAVIFLHGSQEDYIRSILINWFPERANKDALKSITLIGKEGRPQKYELGDLIAYRDRTVGQLIGDSVEYSMGRQTFNNLSEIDTWIKRIGLSLEGLSAAEKGSINTLIQRRHRIVHDVDLDRASRAGLKSNGIAAPINVQMVRSWKKAVEYLVKELEKQIEEWGEQGCGLGNGF